MCKGKVWVPLLHVYKACAGTERAAATCLMKISRRRDWPKGLYLRLKRSKRWKVFLSACMSSVSTLRSYLHACRRDVILIATDRKHHAPHHLTEHRCHIPPHQPPMNDVNSTLPALNPQHCHMIFDALARSPCLRNPRHGSAGFSDGLHTYGSR